MKMTQPEISFITITDDKYDDNRRAVCDMARQTAASEIELIIVGPSRQQMQVREGDLAPFHSFQIIETGPVRSTGAALAEGVRAAKALFVGYVEEHGYPEPSLAATAIRFLRGGDYGAVGWSVKNANPGWVSWASIYGQFGPAVAPVGTHEALSLVGHHAAYRRELLLEYGDQLPALLSNEVMLQMDLHSRGYKLILTGDTAVAHTNVSKFGSYLLIDYLGQRGFAATRARVSNWSWPRRLLYVGGTPLIPFIRLRRSLRDVRRTGRAETLLPWLAFIIFAANCCGAVGEAMGYLFGIPDRAYQKRTTIELNRLDYVVKPDKEPG
jgi:hypothetical protein